MVVLPAVIVTDGDVKRPQVPLTIPGIQFDTDPVKPKFIRLPVLELPLASISDVTPELSTLTNPWLNL